ncbi:hypothetical protein Hypma_009819 [Hypsizygus marmoreus]|uniref:Uncharacterized protein n=1 Tax=Hypsizygus marmoreus TaxID=39966 RepID=A0A369JNU8_HYPMA|nr:hypothetical protein Hypma_009819 [Hypsizygus marmoreus]
MATPSSPFPIPIVVCTTTKRGSRTRKNVFYILDSLLSLRAFPTCISFPHGCLRLFLHAFAPTMSASLSTPESTTLGQTPTKPSSRRHARLHSRNLSVPAPSPNPPSPKTAARSSRKRHLGPMGVPRTSLGMHTQPTPMPVSPWTPMSGFLQSTTMTGFPPHTPDGHEHSHEDDLRLVLDKQQFGFGQDRDEGSDAQNPPGAVAAFVLGAWLWVCGQEVGSLSFPPAVVVIEASEVGRDFGERETETKETKETVWERSSGNSVDVRTGGIPDVLVRLHLQRDSRAYSPERWRQGTPSPSRIEFPIILTFITLISIMGTSLLYNNHSTLVNGMLSLSAFDSHRNQNTQPAHHPAYPFLLLTVAFPPNVRPPPMTPLGKSLSNPFVASPFLFALAILGVAILVPVAQHRTRDLAALITVVTFNVAYRACTVLGTVLLQTSPARGAASGKMEAFLRAMREVRSLLCSTRHQFKLTIPLPPPTKNIGRAPPSSRPPPAPHIWQLKPTPTTSTSTLEAEALVVTTELHVRQDLEITRC